MLVSRAHRMQQLGLTYLEGAKQALVDAHHSTSVVEFTAVIRCAEERHELSLGEELVTVLYDLMGTTDQVHVMLLQEPRHDIWAESKGHASIVLAPASYVLVRVGPEKVAEESAIGDLDELVN